MARNIKRGRYKNITSAQWARGHGHGHGEEEVVEWHNNNKVINHWTLILWYLVQGLLKLKGGIEERGEEQLKGISECGLWWWWWWEGGRD